MTPRQFNELQRQADVIDAHAKYMSPVEQAVRLFVATIPLSSMDAQDLSSRFMDMYDKECELFSIMSRFTKSESSEYKKRIKSELFKWKIKKVKGFFMLNENHDFHDEGHGYIETTLDWGGMQVTVYIYRDVAREVDFFVDTFGSSQPFVAHNARREKERELSEQFNEYIKQSL